MNFIFGLVAALLSGLGVGSGGLLVVFLTVIGEYEQLSAQGINLLFFIFSSGAAMLYHLTHRSINFGAVAMLVSFGITGAFFGSLLINFISPTLIRRIFGGMLVFSGILALKGRRDTGVAKKEKS